MELNENNGLSVLINDATYNFGDVKEDDVIKYEFEFLGNPNQIQYIEKGCGCTSAYFEDGKIKGELDMAKAQSYESGENQVNKYVYVWLNDGQPRFMANNKKEKITNQNKAYFVLKLIGKVIKD